MTDEQEKRPTARGGGVLGHEELWSTATVRDAVRSVVRSSNGLAALEEILEAEDSDPVWGEDVLIALVVDRLRGIKR